MRAWRLILSPRSDLFTNMAVDEAILRSYIHLHQRPTLRIYAWKPAAFSIGVAQKPEEALHIPACRQDAIGFVRRMTGGEAVFHDNEITYSIVCSKQDLALPDSVKQGFRVLSGFIVTMYRELGLDPCFAADADGYIHGNPSDFCFATKEEFDILVRGRKIGGNAQKRIKDIIFQHGSIPLALDLGKISRYFRHGITGAAAPSISLQEAVGSEIVPGDCRQFLINSFKKTFSVSLTKEQLTMSENDLARVLDKEKYSTRQWNFFRREPVEKERKAGRQE
jgi:lipoate-protein ligase A